MADHSVYYIEADMWEPGTWHPHDDNTGVGVKLADGSTWSAEFFSYANVLSLTAKNRQTGENLGGKFFRAKNMFLVDEISRERIEEVVAHLIATGEFERVFHRDRPLPEWLRDEEEA